MYLFIYFNLNDIYCLCYHSCSKFPPVPPSTQAYTHSLRQSPRCCPHPWVIHTCSLATIFPMLSFTSPWLFCNNQFVLLNFFTFFAPPLHSLLSGNHLNVCIYYSVSVLLVHLFCFLDSIIDGYVFIAILLFIFFIFFFLKKTL